MAKDDRLRIPVDDTYLKSLGLALISFARLEWMAVYVTQKIGQKAHNAATDPNYVGTVSHKTAGQIANDLIAAATGITNQELMVKVLPAAKRFKELTKLRNDLMHANPGTAPDGDQRLFRIGTEWTIFGVDDLADEFTGCNHDLTVLYNQVL